MLTYQILLNIESFRQTIKQDWIFRSKKLVF